METNIDFKSLWKQQATRQPNIDALFLKLKHFKIKGLRRLVVSNILLLATTVFIVFIWIYYQPQLVITKIGIVMTILAMVSYLMVYSKLFRFYKSIASTQSNAEYLNDLIAIKRKQHFMQTTMLSLYFALLSVGICLYLYEYTRRMPTLWGIVTYALTLGWIAFNWFFIRPKTIKKQQKPLDELIDNFERINGQLVEELKF